ncbi:hypothetical protein [Caldicellulosiruptor kronotskyensis]|uniref:hypothetical protein n=1 Tax=Caldicellulosiruptor kronotskyensis TaxID=413889 RepID=UPI00030E4FFC|nr:hypothetical protein [Caldicellulosiruptor kronotskyensis]
MIDIFETTAMRELHQIKEKIFEETKDMTTEELIEYFRRRAEKVARELEELKKRNKEEITQ